VGRLFKMKKKPTTAEPQVPLPLPVIGGAILELDDLRGTDRYRAECLSRAATQTVYLGNATVLARVLGRYKAYLDTRDRGFAAHLMLDGYWEMWLTQFIARRVTQGMHVVDVGANFGYYSMLMGDLIGGRGRLLAIEPNPPVAEMLRKTLELNGFGTRSTVIAAAAGAVDGMGSLLVPEGEPKNAMLVSEPDDHLDRALIAVTIRSLDRLLDPFARVDFLKIDAEGAEEDIMTGLSETIARHKPRIILEFNPGRCRDPGAFLARLREPYPLLRCLGYDAQVGLVSDETLLDPTNEEDRLIYLDDDGTPISI
jgi:FkbM family methyltransferase